MQPFASHPVEYAPFENVEARNGIQSRVEIPLLLRLLKLRRGARVLEVGCGRGVALPVLADGLVPTQLVGVDIDAGLVAIAKARIGSTSVATSVIEADVRDLPFDDGHFDLVIDFGTCYHVSGGVTGARRALREIARVLSHGGQFVHETPVAQHLAHPICSFGRTLPWNSAPDLIPERAAVLWSSRRKVGSS